MDNLTLTPMQTRSMLEVALDANLPAIVTSSAGMGKSAIIRELAKARELMVIDIRLSQVSQYDLLGFPKEIDGKMHYVPMAGFPLEGDYDVVTTEEKLTSVAETVSNSEGHFIFKNMLPKYRELLEQGKDMAIVLDNGDKLTHDISTNNDDITGIIAPNTAVNIVTVETIETVTEVLPLNPDTGKPYLGFLLFLDEINSADKYTQGAAYKLLLDRMVGLYNLHSTCRVLAAGNRMQDMAVVSKLVSPMKTRMMHIEMRGDDTETLTFIADKVATGEWHPHILSFLNFKPDNISNFDPDTIGEVTTFACPRTWEMTSDALNAGILNLPEEVYAVGLHGLVGQKAGSDFCAFIDVMAELPDIADIENDPANAPLPASTGARWAIGSYLFNKVNTTNVNAVVEYIERISQADIKVTIYRMMIPKYPLIMRNPDVAKAMGALRKRIQSV